MLYVGVFWLLLVPTVLLSLHIDFISVGVLLLLLLLLLLVIPLIIVVSLVTRTSNCW